MVHIWKGGVNSKKNFHFFVGLELGQGDLTQPAIRQQGWKTLSVSPQNGTKKGKPPRRVVRAPNATGEGLKGTRPPRGNDDGTATWHDPTGVGKRKWKRITDEEDKEKAFEQWNEIKHQENNIVNLYRSRRQPRCSLARWNEPNSRSQKGKECKEWERRRKVKGRAKREEMSKEDETTREYVIPWRPLSLLWWRCQMVSLR